MTHAGQSIQELHARYRVQARWTATLRTRLLDLSRLSSTARVLEVGSGTGVVASETAGTTRAAVVGLDIDPQALRFSRSLYPALIHVVGDGFKLPFADDVFALAYCHFLLMWTHPAVEVLREMRRVVRPGGHVATLAEPDYGGRIDFPAELEALGNRQAERLGAQGADTQIGRRLRYLLVEAGLAHVRGGVLGGEWGAAPEPAELASEWETLAQDLAGAVPGKMLARFREMDRRAWSERRRVLYVPTFYAVGEVPRPK